MDSAGTAYGTTFYGGTINCVPYYDLGCGTLYKVDSAGAFTPLLAFDSVNDGVEPGAVALINGKLVGGTFAGGTGDDGVIYSIDPDGSNLQILHNFQGPDGFRVYVRPIAAPGGYYGIAAYGGTSPYCTTCGGVLFNLGNSGAYASLHVFSGANGDGEFPGDIVEDAAGTIFGATQEGGICAGGPGIAANSCGTLYRYVPSTGAYTVLYRFTDSAADGVAPLIGGVGPDGSLYGAAATTGPTGRQSYGLIWQLKPDGAGGYTFVTLHSFTGGADGAFPYAPAVDPVSGALTGTTSAFSISGVHGAGTLYRYAAGVLTNLFPSVGTVATGKAISPSASPTLGANGLVYGTTLYGGDLACTFQQGHPGCGPFRSIRRKNTAARRRLAAAPMPYPAFAQRHAGWVMHCVWCVRELEELQTGCGKLRLRADGEIGVIFGEGLEAVHVLGQNGCVDIPGWCDAAPFERRCKGCGPRLV